ncbi:YXWGXW repeat-containing protein [Telmatospirillum siberiense]|nr:YXWGXW repeat-containing protein [Telmatospirillum siberiense]
MKSIRSLAVASALSCLMLAGCVAHRAGPPPPPPPAVVYIPRPPPAEMVEAMPPPPDPRPIWVWQKGHWRWDGREYVWHPGHWFERPPHVAEWVPPHWEQHANGWFLIEGHWR